MQCSYCHPEFRSGSNPFPDLEKAILFVDRIHAIHANSNTNRTVFFNFVGGEPTEYESLPYLCQHIKGYSYAVSLMSNAAASLAYWEALAGHIDAVSLTHHEDKIDFTHFGAVCTMLRDLGKRVGIQFAMQPMSFWTSMKKLETLRELGFAPVTQPLYEDHTVRKEIKPYTSEQLEILFPTTSTGDVVVERPERIEYASTHEVIHRRANSFTGMKCGIGTDQLCVSPDGRIRGGWCRVGGVLGNIHHGDFAPPAAPIVCTKETCNNPADLSVPKWRD